MRTRTVRGRMRASMIHSLSTQAKGDLRSFIASDDAFSRWTVQPYVQPTAPEHPNPHTVDVRRDTHAVVPAIPTGSSQRAPKKRLVKEEPDLGPPDLFTSALMFPKLRDAVYECALPYSSKLPVPPLAMRATKSSNPLAVMTDSNTIQRAFSL